MAIGASDGFGFLGRGTEKGKEGLVFCGRESGERDAGVLGYGGNDGCMCWIVGKIII